MQNKPNSQNTKTNLTLYPKKNYAKISALRPRKNKPNSNPIKPNPPAQIERTIKPMKTVTLAVLSTLILLTAASAEAAVPINLRTAPPNGVKVLSDYAGNPDNHGVFETYPIELPAFERAVYYRSGWWPAGGNRVYPKVIADFSDVEEGGIFILLELRAGDYLAILPIAGPAAYSWLDAQNGNLLLKMGTHGKSPIEASIPLYSWAKSADPYEACNTAWKAALNCRQLKPAALMREKKDYPEPFEYLGWCSWEHFHGHITEQNMVKAMKDIENSAIPIRFFLVDNGHFDKRSLAPNEKFPNGYKPLTDLRKPDKIKWVGIWYAFLGANHGIEAPGNLGQIGKYMYECNAGKLLPLPDEKSAKAFYDYMLDFAKKDDVDFLKVDFQTDALPFYAGVSESNPLKGLPADNANAIGNPLAAATNLALAFQSVVEDRMNGLINCNWHNAVSIFNSKNSIAGRCSGDYKVGDLNRARGHLRDSYAATPWIGQIAWGDHDMFHSNDKFAGRMMAVSKAMSGGPVYLSDEPTRFDAQAIYPLVYKDGRLLRPIAPATPLHNDLFYQTGAGSLYRVVAPLPGKTAAIVIYNLDGGVGPDEQVLSATITPDDYTHASAMIQPYPGPWRKPAEGLLVYDWYAGKAQRLRDKYEVSIKGFGDRLLQISPITKAWSVIGRCDKYLSAAAVEVLSVQRDTLKIKMIEAGPLAIWTVRGEPKAKGIAFTHIANGLYKADLAIGEKNRIITISR